MLTTQYRMHHLVMDWSSQEMYQGRLTGKLGGGGDLHPLLVSCAGIPAGGPHPDPPAHCPHMLAAGVPPPPHLPAPALLTSSPAAAAHESVAGHELKDLRGGLGPAAAALPVLLLVDTAGCSMQASSRGTTATDCRRCRLVLSRGACIHCCLPIPRTPPWSSSKKGGK